MSRPLHPNRRQTLQGLGALAGLAATGCGPGEPEPDEVDPLANLKTIVVLMMENRSFDHYFGALTLEEGRDDVDGLSPTHTNPDADGTEVAPFRLDITCQEDPPHSWAASHAQFDGGTNKGFVKAHMGGRSEVSREVMGYYNRADLPIFYALADAHTICDRWFASVMGPTWPNRFYSLCGTSLGMVSNDFSRVPFPARSIFDQLEEAGVSWKVYFHAVPFASLLQDAVDGDWPLKKIVPIDEFFTDLAAGTLPQVVFIEPDYTRNDDHPPHPVTMGQILVGTVYKALAESPYWDGLMMIVNYDEHGGFHDHVVPPTTADDHAAEGFDQLGFRIPGLVLGPYARRGAVVHTTYDHTSVLKTLQERFDLDPLTARNAAAEPLWDCLDLDALAEGRTAPPAELPAIEVDPADLESPCDFRFLRASQPELDLCVERGVVDPRVDRRRQAAASMERLLARAQKLGVLRYKGT